MLVATECILALIIAQRVWILNQESHYEPQIIIIIIRMKLFVIQWCIQKTTFCTFVINTVYTVQYITRIENDNESTIKIRIHMTKKNYIEKMVKQGTTNKDDSENESDAALMRI